MRWPPFVALALTALFEGGTCWWLYSHGEIQEIGILLGMGALTFYFVNEDIYLDELYRRDTKLARNS